MFLIFMQQSTGEVESWLQERTAAGHVVSAVWKQRKVDARVGLLSPLGAVRAAAQSTVLPTFSVGLPFSFTLSQQNPFTGI